MCGPSAAQEGLASQASTFSTMLSQNYAKNFGAQSKILGDLTNMFTPIAAAGPDQQGMGPQELAALNTQAGEGVGGNYAKATRDLNNRLAVRGGGGEVLPTGGRAALEGQLASAGANELSQEELGITRANYAQGRNNWREATAGLNALSQEYNPNAIAGEAASANNNAFGEATTVQKMRNQKESAIGGLVASMIPFAGKGLAGGLSNMASGGREAGSETGGGFEQFFSGGLSALMG